MQKQYFWAEARFVFDFTVDVEFLDLSLQEVAVGWEDQGLVGGTTQWVTCLNTPRTEKYVHLKMFFAIFSGLCKCIKASSGDS